VFNFIEPAIWQGFARIRRERGPENGPIWIARSRSTTRAGYSAHTGWRRTGSPGRWSASVNTRPRITRVPIVSK